MKCSPHLQMQVGAVYFFPTHYIILIYIYTSCGAIFEVVPVASNLWKNDINRR